MFIELSRTSSALYVPANRGLRSLSHWRAKMSILNALMIAVPLWICAAELAGIRRAITKNERE